MKTQTLSRKNDSNEASPLLVLLCVFVLKAHEGSWVETRSQLGLLR